MAYSKIGMINSALRRIGSLRISSLTEDSTQRIYATDAWDYILDEVLEAKDWSFAKTRKALAKNTAAPAFRYDYAYNLPSDFLRLARDRKDDPAVYPSGSYHTAYIFGQYALEGTVYSYSVETLEDGSKILATDYDNSTADLYIVYIRRISDVTKLSASFINAFSFRMAEELCVPLNKSMKILDRMTERYLLALKGAEGHDQSGEYLEDETGKDSWEYAGR